MSNTNNINRDKTEFRHITSDNRTIRVTKIGSEYYIGDTNERAEGKMVHYKQLNYNNGKLPHKQRGGKSYYDWWQQSNLNGDFAYNGVTDDF